MADETQSQQDAGRQGGSPGQQEQQAQQGQQGQQGQQQSGTPGAAQQTGTPGTQAGGYKVQLTDEQRRVLLDSGSLVLTDEQYSGGVRQEMEDLRRRARSAEKRLAEIAAQREEDEKKALVEQERYKELYEKEQQAHGATREGRKTDLIRSAFNLAAVRAGIVDPDLAFIAAKASPLFAKIEANDEGSVSGIDDVVKAIVEQKPFLVSQEQQRQSVGTASNPNVSEAPPPKTLAEAGDRLESTLKTGQL